MESNKKLEITNKVLRIIFYLGYIGVTVFMVYSMVHSYIQDMNRPEGSMEGFALVFALIVLIIGAICYGVLLLIGLIDIIISAVNKNNPLRKRSVLISSISIILPIITYIILIVIGISMAN